MRVFPLLFPPGQLPAHCAQFPEVGRERLSPTSELWGLFLLVILSKESMRRFRLDDQRRRRFATSALGRAKLLAKYHRFGSAEATLSSLWWRNAERRRFELSASAGALVVSTRDGWLLGFPFAPPPDQVSNAGHAGEEFRDGTGLWHLNHQQRFDAGGEKR